jgi:hypothetical protein
LDVFKGAIIPTEARPGEINSASGGGPLENTMKLVALIDTKRPVR